VAEAEPKFIMSDFYKAFLREPGRLPNQLPGPRVLLGALGKHPGWDDHIEGLLDSETLALFKNVFYVQGIGRTIDSGEWDKPEVAADLIDFDHYLMWVRGDQVLLGRLWASSDGRDRTKYPMILCAQCSGVSLDWAVQTILPELDKMREVCRNVRTAAEVRQILQKTQTYLQGKAENAPIRAESKTSLDRAAFLAGPALGPDHVGLMRILHELETNFSAYKKARASKTVAADVRAQHIRAPRNASSPAEALLAWREFLNLLFSRDLPLLFVAPASREWVDIFAGEPSASEIFPLRVQSVGLASSVPYQISPEIKSACAELALQFERGDLAPSGSARKQKSAESSDPGTTTWDKSVASKSFNLKWLAGGGAGLLLILLILFWPRHGRETAVITPPQAGPPAASPPIVAAPPPVVHNVQPPQLSSLKDESIEAGDKFGPEPFTVNDIATPADRLAVKLESSDTEWLPASSLSLDRSGNNWAVHIDPAPSKAGACDVAVIVTDSQGNSSTNHFRLAVAEPAWSAPTLERKGEQQQIIRAGSQLAPVFFQASDRKTPADQLAWSFDSSNPALLPVNNIQVHHEETSWQVTAATEPGQTGTASVTVTVKNGGGLAATSQFEVVVQPPPAPRFDQIDPALNDIRFGRGETARGVVKVSEAEAPAAKLELTARVEPPSWVTVNVSGQGTDWAVELAAGEAAAGHGKLIMELSDGETKITNETAIEVTNSPVTAAVTSAPVTAAPVTAAPVPLTSTSAGSFRNSLGMEFVWVTNLPGTDNAAWDSAHQRGGWVAKYLVTQADSLKVMQINPSQYKDGGTNLPAESVSADDMDGFCEKLTAQSRQDETLPTGWSYQLLTVDQWRFCAQSTHDADCVVSAPSAKRQHPEPVGSLPPNSLGLFDTIGNVYEVTLGSNHAKLLAGANYSQVKSAGQALKILNTFTRPNRWTGFRVAIIPTAQTP
jgi:hypothetical protein